MSTQATIKFVVTNHHDNADPIVTTARLLQHADGYEDFVRPHLEEAQNQMRINATLEEMNAFGLAATYSALVDMEVEEGRVRHGYSGRSSSMTTQLNEQQMERNAGRWQYLVEVDVDTFDNVVEWRILGGSDFT